MISIFVDFEMNQVAPEFKAQKRICSMEIIEIGAVMLDGDLQEISSFKALVRPTYNPVIYKRYAALTGITTEMVQDQETFPPVFRQFLDWCNQNGEAYMVYAWSDSDLQQLTNEIEQKAIERTDEIEYMLQHWTDFQRIFCQDIEMKRALSLHDALGFAGLDFDGKMHDAIYDAKNTARLYVHTKNSDEYRKTRDKIREVLQPPKTLTVSLGDLFNFDQLKLNDQDS